MNPNIIAGLINRVYENFDMFSFDNRLKLQKFTYLMQSSFDLNIGYEFNWYHYGPYCMELTRDAFNIDFSEIPTIKFSDLNSEKKFIDFLEFIKEKTQDWLEIASSIHFLNKFGLNEQQIVKTIKDKREYFKDKEQEIKDIYLELKSGGKL